MPTPLGPRFLQRVLELLGHDVERLVPRDRRELAVLVELAVRLAQQRLREPVVAVHDLGEEIALHAVEAAVDLGLDVAVGRDHAAVLGRDHDAAAGAAEPARRLVPFELGGRAFGDEVLRGRAGRQPARRRRHGGRFELQELAAVDVDLGIGAWHFRAVRRRRWRETRACRQDRRQQCDRLRVVPIAPASGPRSRRSSLPFGSRL